VTCQILELKRQGPNQQEARMQSAFVTRAADFIGQILGHAWRATLPADRLVVMDTMIYAANIRSLEPLIADRAITFVKATSAGVLVVMGKEGRECRDDAGTVLTRERQDISSIRHGR
jgi:hypothetical protein